MLPPKRSSGSDAFIETFDLAALGFDRTVSAATGRPGFHPGDMLRLYVWGYLNQLRSSRQLERACERTPACQTCQIKGQCTPGYQRTIHRLVDQGELDRMEWRIHENPDLMTVRRRTVEHPFGTIKRMTVGGRFLTRGLQRVKAEAALSVLAFNLIRASNALRSANADGTRLIGAFALA